MQQQFVDEAGQPLHIFHAMHVVVRPPDRLAAHVTGDDGSHDLIYDGKSVAVSSSNYNEYVVFPQRETFRRLFIQWRNSTPIFRWSTFLPRLRTNRF